MATHRCGEPAVAAGSACFYYFFLACTLEDLSCLTLLSVCDVNNDWTHKGKVNDQTSRDKSKDKDWAYKGKVKD